MKEVQVRETGWMLQRRISGTIPNLNYYSIAGSYKELKFK